MSINAPFFIDHLHVGTMEKNVPTFEAVDDKFNVHTHDQNEDVNSEPGRNSVSTSPALSLLP